MPNDHVQAAAEGMPAIDPDAITPFMIGLEGDNRSPRVRYFDDIRRAENLSGILFDMLDSSLSLSRGERYGDHGVRLIFQDSGIEKIIALSDEISDRLGHLRRAAGMLFSDEDTGQ